MINPFRGPFQTPSWEYIGSSGIGKSPNDLYWKMKNSRYSSDNEEQQGGIEAQMGTAYHRLSELDLLKNREGYSVETMTGRRSQGITGFIDYLSSKNNALADIKTVGISQMAKIMQKGPRSENVHQLNYYMGSTGADYGMLNYILREDPNMVVNIPVPFNKEMYQRDIRKIKGIQSNIANQYNPDSFKPYLWEDPSYPTKSSYSSSQEYNRRNQENLENETIDQAAFNYLHKMDTYNLIQRRDNYLKQRENHSQVLRAASTDFGSPYHGPKVSNKLARAMVSPLNKVYNRHDMRTMGIGLEFWENRNRMSKQFTMSKY